MELERQHTGGPRSIAYLDDDSAPVDAPTVMFLHGIFDAAPCWSGVLPAFSGRFRLLALDTRGHGRTRRFDDDIRISALADDVAEMIDTLVGGPVILVGHSMGGVIATQAADRYPHLVRALALVDSPLDLARHDDPTVAPEFIRERLHQITTWTPEQIMAKGIADHPGWHADEFAWWAQAKADVEPRLLEARQGWAGVGFDDLPRITLPARFIAGDPATGSMVTSAQLDRVRDAWGPDSATIIANAGHDVHKDARAEFTRVLDDFLTRVSA